MGSGGTGGGGPGTGGGSYAGGEGWGGTMGGGSGYGPGGLGGLGTAGTMSGGAGGAGMSGYGGGGYAGMAGSGWGGPGGSAGRNQGFNAGGMTVKSQQDLFGYAPRALVPTVTTPTAPRKYSSTPPVAVARAPIRYSSSIPTKTNAFNVMDTVAPYAAIGQGVTSIPGQIHSIERATGAFPSMRPSGSIGPQVGIHSGPTSGMAGSPAGVGLPGGNYSGPAGTGGLSNTGGYSGNFSSMGGRGPTGVGGTSSPRGPK